MVIFGIEFPPSAIAGFISATIALCAFTVAWLQWRERQYRKDDVLKWAGEVIRALQTLFLVISNDKVYGDEMTARVVRQLAIDTSVLVEQGRLFFRNVPDPEHGKDKLPAYRGYRPELLDPIVTAHQIACAWIAADQPSRQRLGKLADTCVKSFVSMAQHEVGRSKTLSRETARGGKGSSLQELMTKVT